MDVRRAGGVVVPREERQNGLVELAGLSLFLVAIGAVLYRLAGLPQLPAGIPSRADVFATLQGSELPTGFIVYALTVLCWGFWGWTVGSMALRLVLRAADAFAPGASWVRSLRRLSDRVTLPVVRRIADGAVVATAVVAIATRPMVAEASSLDRYTAVAAMAPAPQQAPGQPQQAHLRQQSSADQQASGAAAALLAETYVVRPNETLWSISETVYGTGHEFGRIVSANAGHRMADGHYFTRAGLIRPGWVLRVPRPDTNVAKVDGRDVYVVQRDDTLTGIATRFLGEADAWRDVFALNRGHARLPDGRTLTHPDLIWPGLTLVLPVSAGAEAAPELTQDSAVAPVESGTVNTTGDGSAQVPPKGSNATVASQAPAAAAATAEIAPASPVDEPSALPEGAGAGEARTHADNLVPSPDRAASAGDSASRLPPDAASAGRAHEAEEAWPRDQGAGAALQSAHVPGQIDAPADVPPRTAPLPMPSRLALTKEAAAAGAMVAAAGGVALAARRLRRRRRLSDAPVPLEALAGALGIVSIADGFADAEFGRGFAQSARSVEAPTGTLEPAVVGAERVMGWLSEQGVQDASLVTIRQERTPRGFSLELTLRAGLADQERLLALAPALVARIGRGGSARYTIDHDVELRVDDIAPLYLLPVEGDVEAQVLIPVGAQSPRHTLYASWRELGHVLVAGAPLASGTVLTSLVAALAARCHPERLRLWTIDGGVLPDALLEFPHQGHGSVGGATRIAPADRAQITAVLRRMVGELERRMRRGETSARPALGDAIAARVLDAHGGTTDDQVGEPPEIVLVVGELADLADDRGAIASDTSVADLLEAIGADGPAYGVYLLAGTSRPEALDDSLLALFGTRFVLEQPDEAQSVRLLGRPDATSLSGGGELFLRIGGRAPVRLRGFRLTPERLSGLARLMREAYGEWPLVRAGGDEDASYEVTDRDGVDHDSEAAAERSALAELPERRPDPARPPGPWTVPVSSGPLGRDAVRDADADGAQPHTDAGAVASGSFPDATPQTLTAPMDSTPLSDDPQTDEAQSGEVAVTNSHQRDSTEADPGRPEHDADATGAADPEVADTGDKSDGPGPSALATRPPVYVQCFAELRVVSARGEVSAEGAAAGYQSWAILAFLAAQPDGSATTEALAGAIWPDVDPDRAATARLSPALSRLRATLAEQVPGLGGPVVVRGRNGFCWLDGDAVASDVQQFVRLCEAARRSPPGDAIAVYEQARALYRGELLARQAYEWVDRRERDGLTPLERYQRLYHAISCELAEIYCRRGEPARALPLYRRVLADDPTAEDVARRLFRCYGELGDRPALLREYRRLKQQLRRVLSDPDDPDDSEANDDDPLYEPEAETVGVYLEVLAQLEVDAAGPPASGVPADDAAG